MISLMDDPLGPLHTTRVFGFSHHFNMYWKKLGFQVFELSHHFANKITDKKMMQKHKNTKTRVVYNRPQTCDNYIRLIFIGVFQDIDLFKKYEVDRMFVFHMIAVHSQFGGRGIGTQLVLQGIEHATRFCLSVLSVSPVSSVSSVLSRLVCLVCLVY